MRKGLIATAVAVALFAVGAFAASFAVNSEDIASGSNPVTACAARVDIDFETVYHTSPVSNWQVPSAVVKFYSNAEGTPSPTGNCGGYGTNVVIENAAGVVIATGTATVPPGPPAATSVTVNLNKVGGGALGPADIHHAAVLVDGQELFVPTPNQGINFPPPE
jgi:hypothetical protein